MPRHAGIVNDHLAYGPVCYLIAHSQVQILRSHLAANMLLAATVTTTRHPYVYVHPAREESATTAFNQPTIAFTANSCCSGIPQRQVIPACHGMARVSHYCYMAWFVGHAFPLSLVVPVTLFP
jgi:hypothetical protein